MALKTSLDALTMEAAVLGGALLGCGGGGKLEDGLYLGELAVAQGGAFLSDANILPDQAIAAVMPVHSSGSDTHQIHPRQTHDAAEMLQANMQKPIAAIVNGGLGAVDSILGWELSGFLGLPLLDGGLPAAYHAASLPNLLAYRQETAGAEEFTVALAGRAHGGRPPRRHLWHGRPAELQQQLAALPHSEKESYAAAAGPILPTDLRPGAVSRTLHAGRTLLDAGDDGGEATVAALQAILPSPYAVFATVTGLSRRGQGQDAAGHIHLRCARGRPLQLTYAQRYQELIMDGRQTAAFPDLIITLGILGTPLTGEEVFIGQDLYLITVPQEA